MTLFCIVYRASKIKTFIIKLKIIQKVTLRVFSGTRLIDGIPIPGPARGGLAFWAPFPGRVPISGRAKIESRGTAEGKFAAVASLSL